MADRVIFSCLICGTRAETRPPRYCPKCGVPAAKFRLVVDRDPSPIPSEVVGDGDASAAESEGAAEETREAAAG